jgi:Ceramidase
MLFTTGVVLHRILTTSSRSSYTTLVGVCLTIFLVLLSYVHCAIDELILHAMTFGTMIAVIGLKTMGMLSKIENTVVRRKVGRLARGGAGRCLTSPVTSASPAREFD